MRRHRLVAVTITVLVLGASAPARADRAEAEHLFLEARKLVLADRCSEAVELLQRSLQADPSVGALLNLGTCEETLGHFTDALRTFQRAEQLARRTDAERTEEAVRRQIAIEARVGSIRVRTRDDGASIEVNGLRAAVGERIVLPPGTYDVVALAPGRQSATTKVTVTAGKHDVTVDVGPLLRLADDHDASSESTASRAASSPSGVRLGPWLTIGAGALALGAGGLTGVLASQGRSELDDLCPRYPACPASQLSHARDVEGRTRTTATISTISVTGAVVLLGIGITWLLLEPRPANARLQSGYPKYTNLEYLRSFACSERMRR